MLWGWRPLGFRWLVTKQQNLPKFYVFLISLSSISFFFKISRPEIQSEEGLVNKNHQAIYEAGNKILDDKKITVLAHRRWKMIQDKAEAEEYFKSQGFKPRPSNQFIIVSDSLGN